MADERREPPLGSSWTADSGEGSQPDAGPRKDAGGKDFGYEEIEREILDIIPQRDDDVDDIGDDGEVNEYEDLEDVPDENSGRGRVGLLLAVLVGAVVVVAAGWYLFAHFNGARQPSDIPVIASNDEPYKVRPADPGGMQVPNRDKMVYDRVNGGEEGGDPASTEQLLPPPESPVAPPEAPAGEASQGAGETAMPTETVGAPATPAMAPAEPANPPAGEPPSEPAVTVQVPDAPSAAAAAGAPEPAAVPTAPTPTPEVAAVSTEAPTAPTSSVSAADGKFLIQLAALREEAAAAKEWVRLSKKYPDLLGGYEPVIQRADLGDRGIYYRLRMGHFVTRESADKLCGEIKAQQLPCMVVPKD